MTFNRRLSIAAGIALMLAAAPAAAQTAPDKVPAAAGAAVDLKAYVPSTVSPEAHTLAERMRAFSKRGPFAEANPDPKTVNAAAVVISKQFFEPIITKIGTTISTRALGGVDVVDVVPKGYVDDGTLLIYVHGGGFVYFTAKTNLIEPALMAQATGRHVISIDYTTAPAGKWQTVTDQIIAVYKAVLAGGHKASRIGVFGSSAGGDIAAASILKLRDQGLPMPAGLLLLSPVTDLTGAGDTQVTLAPADPGLTVPSLRWGYDAYAAPADQTNPYVSPVYGDFSKGYPPVLIQGGTKELLLSDFVRLNRAIRRAGGTSDLDLYEGMGHDFQGLMILTDAPEGREAYASAASFWKRVLPARSR